MKVNFNKNTKPAPEKAPLPEVQVTVLAEGRNGLKAFATLRQDGMFYNGLRVFEGANGLYVQYPARDTGTTDEEGNKKYSSYYTPTKELREELNKKVLAAYYEAVGQTAEYEPAELELPADAVRVTLCKENTWGGLAFVRATYKGMYLNDLLVKVSKTNDPYVVYPSRIRMKDGEEVIGDNGYKVRDPWYGAMSAEVRKELDGMILAKVQEEYEKANA